MRKTEQNGYAKTAKVCARNVKCHLRNASVVEEW